MATEEFDSKHANFCWTLGKMLSIFPPLLLIGFGVFYFIGSFRPNHINSYNKRAIGWKNNGLNSFKNQIFNLTNSSGETTLVANSYYDGDFYPVRDSCKQQGDPKGGCVYTDALFYEKSVFILETNNHYIIENSDGHIIIDNRVDANTTYIKTAKMMGCSNQLTCSAICDEMDGEWNPNKRECKITVFIDGICYRVITENGVWRLDTKNAGKLPKNKAYKVMKSDGVGCDYGNNWNSLHYGKKRKPMIMIQIRSSMDSYIAASGYTQSCSNDYSTDMFCFGPTHSAERWWNIVCILVSLCLVFVELIVFIPFHFYMKIYTFVKILGRYKHKKAIDQQESNKSDLLSKI